MALAMAGCAAGDADLDEVDPEAAPATPTWTAHIERLMDRYCTECHAADAQPGKQGGFGFATCEETRRHRQRVEAVVFKGETMPPGGAERLRSWEKLMLARWYAQGATCE
jgi:uncharacterized membrane protein